MNTLTKLGLTGNSGFIGNIHVSAPYAAGRGMVFVETDDIGWARVNEKMANRHKSTIIKCYHCDEPAIRLDHLWPYHIEYNACWLHLEAVHWEMSDTKPVGKLCRVVDGKLVVIREITG